MFYFESDRAEIKNWIKDSEEKVHTALEKKLDFTDIFEEIQRKNRDYITNQLVQLNAEFQAQLSLLKREIIQQVRAEFQAEIDNLKSKFADLKKSVPQPTKIETSPEEIFYLKPCDEVLISDNRENISAQISKALNVDDIKKFLAENKTETSRKFQKLINSHVNSVKSFVENLKLNSLDDEELSETVTSKYFKLFQAIIFDNLIVAVKRGLNTSKFYGEFLTKLNDYLERCGIYTVNAKSDVKATDEDYKNMSPQPIKTSDKTQAGIIHEIERLPYRINYIDEFGEEKFLQYNGIMNIFKAV